ncbi:MAG TPA: serine/threonine-protein kinase [Thermoleophilia bacterium]|nr:serine/threonine-protein kinase [Thermoleophilia bacterium]HQG03405.1 serine/threonine-protein kinase [Thermoleophilia bacterium]
MPAATQNATPLDLAWRERYEVLARLGSGGFAEVFEARDRRTGRHVALKVVGEGRGMAARVVREIEAATALSHPNIVSLYDYFSDGQRSYLVWELVVGRSLAELGGRLSDADVAAVGSELLDALGYAHGQRIVHRDVKPQNVMLDEHGRVKVMDFGIALMIDAETLTAEGDVIGTLAYMSPEQAAGRRAGPASDVYSAGIVLYELLAGRNPLRGESAAETLSNVAAHRLPPLRELRPDLTEGLAELIDAACEAQPGRRPNACELSDALRALLESGALGTSALRRAQSVVRPLGRAAAVVERGGGAALAGVAAAAVLAKLPAYPASWTLPLVALSVGAWAVVPRAGLAWLLAVMAFPMFNVSLGVGIAYLVFAVILFLLTGGRPVCALWPVLALLLTPLYLTLLAPAGAAVLGRVRGPLTAAWAGAATMFFLLLERAPRGPFTGFQPRGHLARELARADGPLEVARDVLGVALSWPCLTQMAVWAALAAVMGAALRARGAVRRLWIWALGFAMLFTVYRAVPIAAWGYRAALTDLLASVVVGAAVVLLPLLLWPSPTTEGPIDERAEVG